MGNEQPLLAEIDADELQELKEAVCDAVLERTRRVVSGEREHGGVILGEKPSRVLSSGFILPRLNVDGDDESSDIRIASHGLDLRLRMGSEGPIEILPKFVVYLRALPTKDELFARNGRLVPPADFSPTARRSLKEQIKARLGQRPKDESRAARIAAYNIAAKDVLRQMGVQVPDGQPIADLQTDTPEESGDLEQPWQDFRTRLRIPSGVSRSYEVPQKWVRVPVEIPPLLLSLPFNTEKWQADCQAHTQAMLAAVRAACEAWIASPEGQALAWRPGAVPSEAFWEPSAWDQFLAHLRKIRPDPVRLIPKFDLQVLVDVMADTVNPGVASVRIALENLREHDSSLEAGFFGVSLEVSLPANALVPLRLERIRRSYHLAGFLSMPAMGVNSGVEDRGEENGVQTLRTTWMPRFSLPRMSATEFPQVPTAYAVLADPQTDVSALGDLAFELDRWTEQVAETIPKTLSDEAGSPEDEVLQRSKFREDLAAWRAEAERIRRGVRVLQKAQEAWRKSTQDPRATPYNAWLLLNRAFNVANPPSSTRSRPGWRLFQLAFVLAHVPTLASRIPGYEHDFDASFDEDSASLLYMSTGGGKTEAFFGIVVYALFLDRLRGKRRGVTAMMHYPLRLLTIQQAQRLARLLAKAELVRQQERIPGAAFEIGFWVGSSNTPNQTEQDGKVNPDLKCVPIWSKQPLSKEPALTHQVTGDRAYLSARDAWNKLPFCPFCGASTALRLFPSQHHRLAILCTGEKCPWTKVHGSSTVPVPLPFLLVDSDIYHRAPAVLLGTIDKLALIGQNPYTVNKIAGMFGMARLLEGGEDGLLHSSERDPESLPANHERIAPSWADGKVVFYDPLPSLIVQDEMHLLDESLGTFGGVFETALYAWFTELASFHGEAACRVPGAPDKVRLPHVIGATATAADAAKHVGALYQKRVVQFPHPGPSLYESFYVRLAGFSPGSDAQNIRGCVSPTTGATPRDTEAAAPWARVYASLMTNGRLHTVTTLSVLAAHGATISRWLKDLTSQIPSRQDRAAHEILENLSEARWAGRRQAVLNKQILQKRYRHLTALVDLHRIQLTYVTNKKGGDQILSALWPEVVEAHAAMGPEYEVAEFRMELISGGVDVKGIQAVIQQAEAPFEPASDDIAQALRGIVATSAISHGVDVETFNAMAFAGMPSDIAEYIQASSRVGRTHVGFSLLIPTPQARRDRFVVSVHEAFHRLLERMIAPPAIERWAERAIERTICSLVQTWLAGIHYQASFVTNKGKARFPSTVEAVDAVFKGVHGPANRQSCIAFVQSAIGIGSTVGGPGNSAHYYSTLVQLGIDELKRELSSQRFTGQIMAFWGHDQNPLRKKRPMTSLRDVDDAGTITGAQWTVRNKKIDAAALAASMAFLRNRGLMRSRRTAQSDTDSED